MSAELDAHTYEVVVWKPNKTRPDQTRQESIDACRILCTYPDCIGILLEGLQVEDDSIALRVMGWTSYESHRDRFVRSDTFKELVNACGNSTLEMISMKHYNFSRPLSLKPMPAIVEYLSFSLKPDVPFDGFLSEWNKAMKFVICAKGCTGYTVGKQVEDPMQVLQLQAWHSLEDHTEAFPKMPGYKDFKGQFRVLVEKYMLGGWHGLKGWHVRTCPPGTAV